MNYSEPPPDLTDRERQIWRSGYADGKKDAEVVADKQIKSVEAKYAGIEKLEKQAANWREELVRRDQVHQNEILKLQAEKAELTAEILRLSASPAAQEAAQAAQDLADREQAVEASWAALAVEKADYEAKKAVAARTLDRQWQELVAERSALDDRRGALARREQALQTAEAARSDVVAAIEAAKRGDFGRTVENLVWLQETARQQAQMAIARADDQKVFGGPTGECARAARAEAKAFMDTARLAAGELGKLPKPKVERPGLVNTLPLMSSGPVVATCGRILAAAVGGFLPPRSLLSQLITARPEFEVVNNGRPLTVDQLCAGLRQAGKVVTKVRPRIKDGSAEIWGDKPLDAFRAVDFPVRDAPKEIIDADDEHRGMHVDVR